MRQCSHVRILVRVTLRHPIPSSNALCRPIELAGLARKRTLVAYLSAQSVDHLATRVCMCIGFVTTVLLCGENYTYSHLCSCGPKHFAETIAYFSLAFWHIWAHPKHFVYINVAFSAKVQRQFSSDANWYDVQILRGFRAKLIASGGFRRLVFTRFAAQYLETLFWLNHKATIKAQTTIMCTDTVRYSLTGVPPTPPPPSPSLMLDWQCICKKVFIFLSLLPFFLPRIVLLDIGELRLQWCRSSTNFAKEHRCKTKCKFQRAFVGERSNVTCHTRCRVQVPGGTQ